jgi:PAS domain S-box-containing protein
MTPLPRPPRPTIIPEKSYRNKLLDVLVGQSKNPQFYNGETSEGSKSLTREVVKALEVDRASVWLYSKNKQKIVCEQLYVGSEDTFYSGIELHAQDFPEYFHALEFDPVIIADDAESHPATSCFLRPYLKPLGIKSMLDVPIVHRKNVLGVICIESRAPRTWTKEEINFAQMLSPLYSLAYNAKQSIHLEKELLEIESFIEQNDLVDQATLLSKADAAGRITYANKKFAETSGYSVKELVGKDHEIINSGMHEPEFWRDMYEKTVKLREVWHAVVTNKRKNGDLYYVDTYVKAHFNPVSGKLSGYSSVRQDVTQIVESMKELDKKNTYLEYAAKILRHDMHSGINTYIPRGITSLVRRLTPELIETHKLGPPLRLLREGLTHTQKVYKGVKEFTNLVKNGGKIEKEECDLRQILTDYLSTTAYADQVAIDILPKAKVNEPLFCTAIDNLIRNGIKYNDSDFKMVAIFMVDDDHLAVQDNGRGMSNEEFKINTHAYVRRANQKEKGTGLGLNIAVAILQEHGFEVTCSKQDRGTQIRIKIRD